MALAEIGDDGMRRSSTIRSSSSISSTSGSRSILSSIAYPPLALALAALELRFRWNSERSKLKLDEGVREVGVFTGWPYPRCRPVWVSEVGGGML